VLSQCTVCWEKAQVLSQCTVWWEKVKVLPARPREKQQRRQLQRSWCQGKRRPPEKCDSCEVICIFSYVSMSHVWTLCLNFYVFCLLSSHGPYIWTSTMYGDLMYVILICVDSLSAEMCWNSVKIQSKLCQNSVKTLSKFYPKFCQNSIENWSQKTQHTWHSIWYKSLILPFIYFSTQVLQVQKAHSSPTLNNSIQIGH